jgi:ComF family protein
MKRVFSCAPYNDKLLQRLLKDFKYGRAHALAKPLAQYAIWWLSKNEYLGDIKTNIDFIVPVPMHKRKQKSRGFNHAQYLAEEFSKLVDIPSATDILVKTRKTKPQAETENEQERQENLKNALALAPSSDALHEKNVLLIDDIATTGSTLRECSIALKPAKPKEIWALTIAQD